jgi:glucose/arabinose dehydrogenase
MGEPVMTNILKAKMLKAKMAKLTRSTGRSAIRLFGLLGAFGFATEAVAAQKAEDLYKSYCATCHGADMSGGLGLALNDSEWKYGASDSDITKVIKEGLPKVGMPAWNKTLSDEDIRALVILIRERGAATAVTDKTVKSSNSSLLSGAGHNFSLEEVATAPGELWGMDFLADGTIIATQKDGNLWLFKKGERLGPVQGTPKVMAGGQGGLLAVQRHPDVKAGWIYLTFSDPSKNGSMTKVVRGKLDGLQWVEEQTVYAADPKFYTEVGHHFGSRLVFQNGYIYFSIGDRGMQDQAQDITRPNGKIHRLHDDGRVPSDNPFIDKTNAVTSIWSYGHRNPQGLAINPVNGDLWGAEHGPRGGDELNVVSKGLNYGWPVITYGMNYDGTPITKETHKDGMEQPKHYWVPSIAASDIEFYTGEHFPSWRNQLLVGSLAKQQLRLVRIAADKVIGDELVLQGHGRIRDVATGPDGYPYVVLNNPNGIIYRLVPGKP